MKSRFSTLLLCALITFGCGDDPLPGDGDTAAATTSDDTGTDDAGTEGDETADTSTDVTADTSTDETATEDTTGSEATTEDSTGESTGEETTGESTGDETTDETTGEDTTGGSTGEDPGAPCENDADDTPCDLPEWAGDKCIVAGSCNAGECVAQAADCDDAVECTKDSCDPDAGCVNEEGPDCASPDCDDPADCEEELGDLPPCKAAACVAGTCVAAAVIDGTACVGPGAAENKCLEGGECEAGNCIQQVKDCDDSLECTADSCDPSTGGCVNAPQGDGCGVDCDADTPCPGGEFCDDGFIPGGAGLCKPLKEDGVACKSTTECKSGLCGGCVNGSVINAGWCYTAASKIAGEGCKDDDECTSGSCTSTCAPFPTNGACECVEDTDCPAADYCAPGSLGGFFANNCKPKKGECGSCGDDGMCTGDDCSADGACATPDSVASGGVCCDDQQCDGGFCEDAACIALKANDEPCVSNDECAGGLCSGIINAKCADKPAECSMCILDGGCGTGAICATLGLPIGSFCIEPDSKDLGDACCKNAQCTAGTCQGGVCAE